MAELLPWLIAAALIIGIGKGGFPVAAALAVPFLALVMNPVQAAALVLPVLIVADCAAIWLYRRHYSRRNLAILLPAMGLGLVIATLIVPNASEPLLLAFTGCAGLWTVWRQWFVSSPVTTRNAGIASGAFWGIVAGITSFLTHSGAPATQAYL
ncbi:MAG: sulfite exporter TauE/SafE family protein, partial [Boseongicola sp. SB0667_bin_21]|nr:sulfite exporter TauE/SafE family protein [Boseongicola sp. SB0667_bin_21]